MKLGEALIKRDEYLKRQENLKKRVKSNIVLKDDNESNENPNDLIKEYIEINNELSDLIIKISNKENNTKLEIGISISEAINIKDKLYREMDIYKTILKELNSKEYRNAKNEVKMKVLVNVKEIQTELDKLSKAYNDIDVIIQSANWNTDLWLIIFCEQFFRIIVYNSNMDRLETASGQGKLINGNKFTFQYG